MEKQKLLNTYVNNVNMEETLSAIENMVESGEKKYVVAINVDVVMKIEDDPYLKKITDDADMVLVDGKPLVWISKMHKKPVKAKISGSDLVPLLCAEASRKGIHYLLLGAKKGLQKKQNLNWNNNIPRLILLELMPHHLDLKKMKKN